MEFFPDYIEIVEKMDGEVKSEITDLELEVKIEKSDENEHMKTEVFEKKNNYERFQITGEKRKNQELSDLEIENKKIKEEYVEFEEIDNKQGSQATKDINLEDLKNQVTFFFSY
jgi:hypothetical protein